MITINSGVTVSRTWPAFKKLIDGTQKTLMVQSELSDDGSYYQLFTIDGHIVYRCDLFVVGKEPAGFSGDDITNNTTWVGDYLTNWDSTSNHRTGVSIFKPDQGYTRRYGFSPNFTDQTTWWEQATKVTSEAVGTGNGSTTVFNLAHGSTAVTGEAILDTEHGKITEEDFLAPPGGSAGDYKVSVSVAGTAKTQRECFETSGGDYTFNYTNGVITFLAAPANSAAITCTYWYIPANVGPTFTFKPNPGKKLFIDDAECSFSSDIAMTDIMYSGAWLADYGIWAPIARNPTPYKTIMDYFNYTYGAFPTEPAIASANGRGTQNSSLTLRWDFKSSIQLNSGDTGSPCFKMATKHNRKPFTGETATITLYCFEL